jgi:hypothetical protein
LALWACFNHQLAKMFMNEPVAIHSADYWVKVVEMLQQNWALIEEETAGAARVYFVTDTSGVFDEIAFPSARSAHEALAINGFRRFAESTELQSFLRPPAAPFRRTVHPNGPIYSSGRFWRS